MKTIIVYGSQIDPNHDRQKVKLPDGGDYYIRIYERALESAPEALESANPEEGETVLNSVELD